MTLYPGVIYGPGPATEGNLVGRLMRDHLRRPTARRDRAGAPLVVRVRGRRRGGACRGADARRVPPRDYVVGGVNAPQQAIYEFLRDARGRPLPRRLPDAVAIGGGARAGGLFGAHRDRAPLLTRGVVEIFGHDWSLDSTRGAERISACGSRR